MKLLNSSILSTLLVAQAAGQQYYPNWGSSPHVCLSTEDNPSVPAGTPVFANLKECCVSHYGWNIDECLGTGPSLKYFPNWGSTPNVCLLDNGTNDVPPGAPLYDDLTTCCENMYSWNLNECNNATPPPSTNSPTSSPNVPTTTAPTTSNLRGGTNSPVVTSSPSPTEAPTQPPPFLGNLTSLISFDIRASDGEDVNGFANAMDAFEDLLLVGARNDDFNRGAAYIFQRDSTTNRWLEKQKLVASDAALNDRFGSSVAIDQDLIVVGAPRDDSRRGAVYVFQKDASGNFTQNAKLVSNQRNERDLFGSEVAIFNGIILVGAEGQAAIHVFEQDGTGTWIPQQVITPSSVPSESLFGTSMAIEFPQGVLFAGAPGGNGSAGRVFVFARASNGTWVEEGEIDANDIIEGDHFGSSLSVDGQRLAVGAPRLGLETRRNVGATFVFDWEAPNGVFSYTEMGTVTHPDGDAFDEFGTSVLIAGNTLVVGSPLTEIFDAADDDAVDRGAAYIFRETGLRQWTEAATIRPAVHEEYQRLGYSLARSSGTLFVGAEEGKFGGFVTVVNEFV